MSEENKALIKRYQEAYNSNKLEELDDILDPDMVMHSPTPGAPPGVGGTKMVHQGLLQAFPDLHFKTEELVAEGDKVVQRFTVSGTDEGGFMGAPPTGKHYGVGGVSIFRIANGKIVEHWGLQDLMGITQQLGMGPGA